MMDCGCILRQDSYLDWEHSGLVIWTPLCSFDLIRLLRIYFVYMFSHHHDFWSSLVVLFVCLIDLLTVNFQVFVENGIKFQCYIRFIYNANLGLNPRLAFIELSMRLSSRFLVFSLNSDSQINSPFPCLLVIAMSDMWLQACSIHWRIFQGACDTVVYRSII